MSGRLAVTLRLFDALVDVRFMNAHGRQVVIAKSRGAPLDPDDPSVLDLVKRGHLRAVPDFRGEMILPWSGSRPWR